MPPSGFAVDVAAAKLPFPVDVVRTAINTGAHHVDIGVAHWRTSADVDWLAWLVAEIGGPSLSRSIHVEEIVWGLWRCGLAANNSIPATGDAGLARRQNASEFELGQAHQVF
jgi:hypothetical protein